MIHNYIETLEIKEINHLLSQYTKTTIELQISRENKDKGKG